MNLEVGINGSNKYIIIIIVILQLPLFKDRIIDLWVSVIWQLIMVAGSILGTFQILNVD